MGKDTDVRARFTNASSVTPAGEFLWRHMKMPRYLIERNFPDTLQIPVTPQGAGALETVVTHNADLGVTGIHSYVSDDKHTTFCVYDAPSPESIRKAAERNGLPVGRITRVTVLDPYFYH